MSAMLLLPDLPAYPSRDLAHEVSSLAMPGRSLLRARVEFISHPVLPGIEAERSINRYNGLQYLVWLAVKDRFEANQR